MIEILLWILKILAALLMLGVLIMIHEFGHFIVAKLTGVRVNEFAMGMGPRLLKFGKGETVYSLRAFPIGGFCAMEGEDEGTPTPTAVGGNESDLPPADPSRSFANKKVWQRLLIVVAGAVLNLVLGYVLLVVYYGCLQSPQPQSGQVLFPTTTIARLEEDTAAYKSGLRPGDTILEVNGRRIILDTDLFTEMQSDEDGVLDMVVRRQTSEGTDKVHLAEVAFETAKDEETGRQYLKYDFAVLGLPRTVGRTFVMAAKQEVSMATVVCRSLVDMVRGRYGLNDLSGPVGTVGVITDAVSQANTLEGWRVLIQIMALITINLGVFNLLPLPALDGGRLVFLVWEGITRRPVPAKYEGVVHLVGMVLLLLLMLIVTCSDVFKFFG